MRAGGLPKKVCFMVLSSPTQTCELQREFTQLALLFRRHWQSQRRSLRSSCDVAPPLALSSRSASEAVESGEDRPTRDHPCGLPQLRDSSPIQLDAEIGP